MIKAKDLLPGDVYVFDTNTSPRCMFMLISIERLPLSIGCQVKDISITDGHVCSAYYTNDHQVELVSRPE